MLTLVYWHWFLAAAVFLTLEMLTPGVAMIWFALAAALTGGIVWLAPGLDWQEQAATFAVLGLAAFLTVRFWVRAHPAQEKDRHLNRRIRQYHGHVFELETALVNGQGKVRIGGDTVWSVTGPDLPAGAKVRVTGSDGVTLQVEPVDGTAERR